MLARGMWSTRGLRQGRVARAFVRHCASVPKEMRAVVLQQFGPAEDALDYLYMPVLEPLPSQVLVKVAAASLNPIDVARRLGRGAGVMQSTNRQLPHVLGQDCSGTVAAVGKRVTNVKVGEEVMALAPPLIQFGTHAEYVTLPADLVTAKPAHLTHVEAASLPWAGYMATRLQRPAKPGSTVLLHGGSGGVGIALTQMLKQKECRVVVTCSPESEARAKAAGADEVLDYGMGPEEVARRVGSKTVDHVVDLHGDKEGQGALAVVLRKGGLMVGVHMEFLDKVDQSKSLFVGGLKTLASTYGAVMRHQLAGVTFHYEEMDARIMNESGLVQLATWAKEGKLRSDVHRVFALDEAIEAHELLESGEHKGKVVLDMTL